MQAAKKLQLNSQFTFEKPNVNSEFAFLDININVAGNKQLNVDATINQLTLARF